MYWGKNYIGGGTNNTKLFDTYNNFIHNHINDKTILKNSNKIVSRLIHLDKIISNIFTIVKHGGSVEDIMKLENVNKQRFIPLNKAEIILKKTNQIIQEGGQLSNIADILSNLNKKITNQIDSLNGKKDSDGEKTLTEDELKNKETLEDIADIKKQNVFTSPSI